MLKPVRSIGRYHVGQVGPVVPYARPGEVQRETVTGTITALVETRDGAIAVVNDGESRRVIAVG